MRCTCSPRELYRILQRLRSAVSRRSTLPCLSTIRLTAEQGRLCLCATNLTIGIMCWITAQVEQDGSMAVPAHLLEALVKQRLHEERVALRAVVGHSSQEIHPDLSLLVDEECTIACTDVGQFPAVRLPETQAMNMRLPCRLLKEMIGQVAYAASPDGFDLVLSSVWISLSAEALTVAAGERTRCAMRTIPAAKVLAFREVLLVPARPLATIAALLPRKGEVQVIVDRKGVLCFRTEAGDFLVRLNGCEQANQPMSNDLVAQFTQRGTCRPFEPYIPRAWHTLIIVPKKALLAVVRKQALPMLCMLETEDEQAFLILRVYQRDEVTTHRIPVQASGTALPPLWLDMRYLADTLASPGTPASLVLAFGESSTDPILLRWVDDGCVETSFSSVFAPRHPYAISRHVHVRRHLGGAAQEVLGTLLEQMHARGLDTRVCRVGEDALYRVVTMLEFALRPTEEEIQHSVSRLAQLLSWRDDQYLLDACQRHFDEVTEALALGAFAPGGSCLELPTVGVRLVFDAAHLQAALQVLQERCQD